MNRGTSICVGQARVHGASKQNRQRAASTRASSTRQRRRDVGEPSLQAARAIASHRLGTWTTPVMLASGYWRRPSRDERGGRRSSCPSSEPARSRGSQRPQPLSPTNW